LSNEGDQVRRRRECVVCKERFTTYESAELSLPKIVKTNGSRESFNENKLRAGMLRALEKRPVSSDLIEAAINRIKKQIFGMGERDVNSRVIGESVMQALRGLDDVAYVRFASVYRSFQDVNEFREVIERLEDDPVKSSDG